MKRIVISVFLLFLLFSLAPSAGGQPQAGNRGIGTLTIIMDGFPSDTGSANVALCNSAKDFEGQGKPLRVEAVGIKNGKARCTISGVPFGEYAVKVFHDENGNGKLDRNALGMPEEAYGFSNNVRGAFGPPDFSEAAFKLNSESMTLRITVK